MPGALVPHGASVLGALRCLGASGPELGSYDRMRDLVGVLRAGACGSLRELAGAWGLEVQGASVLAGLSWRLRIGY